MDLRRVRAFTYARQGLGRPDVAPADALHAVVGVYSAHPTAPLALHARSARLDAAAFAALDGVRIPAMRGSIHLVPRATAHLAFAAVPETAAAFAARLRRFGVPPERVDALAATVRAAAAEPRTQRELTDALGEGDEVGKGIVATMTRLGTLVRVGADGLRSNALRYVAADLPGADPAEALAWLAGAYLRGYGPARREDLAWWAGVPAERAAAALAAHDVVDAGDGLLLLAQDADAFAAAAPVPSDAVDVLPKWDALTMGHRADGRARLVDPALQDRVYDGYGDGLGVVLVGGLAAGAWSLRGSARRIEVALELFEAPGARLRAAIEARFADVAALLGAREVALLDEPPTRR